MRKSQLNLIHVFLGIAPNIIQLIKKLYQESSISTAGYSLMGTRCWCIVPLIRRVLLAQSCENYGERHG